MKYLFPRRLEMLVLVGCWGLGCGTKPTSPVAAGGAWQIAAVETGRGEVREPETPPALPELLVLLDGPPGFARATIAVERTAPGSAPRQSLYDAIFPVEGPVRLVASVEHRANPQPPARVQIRVESGLESSVTFVEPGVPFLDPQAQVTLAGLAGPGGSIEAGREVELGRWAVVTAAETARVTVRILLSRQPTGPRLKPEARPPR